MSALSTRWCGGKVNECQGDMVTGVSIDNFKQFEHVEFELDQSVVFIGPNNSGKTSIFQALCLWETGVRKYIEAKRLGRLNKTGGVTLNRQVLTNTPIDSMKLLWRNQQCSNRKCGQAHPQVPLSVKLEGADTSCGKWKCAAQFIYYNEESFTCRIIEGEEIIQNVFDRIQIHFGFLQTMSGISSMEDKLTDGSIARYLGEGKTAKVIRNLCYNLLYPEKDLPHQANPERNWNTLVELMQRMFGVHLNKPVYIKETGIINLTFSQNNKDFPISSAGRGFQQILLLLTYILSNKNSVLLLDEPDAHLEIVRQREIFNLVNELAANNGSQILIASHSAMILNSASESNSNIIALLESKAYPIFDNKNIGAIRKALVEYGWDRYAAARMCGHILFMERETDLKIMTALAKKLRHPVAEKLFHANVFYVHGNDPNKAVATFTSLKTFFPALKGLAVFDKLEKNLSNSPLKIIILEKRELENYIVSPSVLYSYAESLTHEQGVSAEKLREWMRESIEDNTTPARFKNLDDIWWSTEKITDNWLDLVFPSFNAKLPNKTNYRNFKTDYWKLVNYVSTNDIPQEIKSILEEIDFVVS